MDPIRKLKSKFVPPVLSGANAPVFLDGSRKANESNQERTSATSSPYFSHPHNSAKRIKTSHSLDDFEDDVMAGEQEALGGDTPVRVPVRVNASLSIPAARAGHVTGQGIGSLAASDQVSSEKENDEITAVYNVGRVFPR